MLPFKGRDRRRVAADGAATSIVAAESSRTVGGLGIGGGQAYQLAPRPPTTADPELSAPSPDPGYWDFKSRMRRGESDREIGAAGGRCKRRSRRSWMTTRPRGDCGMRRRVFTCGFPHHVEDHGPSHRLTVIPTAGGAASAAAAQPRIAAARGVVS